MGRLPVGVVLIVLVAACTSAGAGAGSRAAPAAAPGGIYRVGVPASFGFSDDLDPTGEYYYFANAIYYNLLFRPLLNTDHTPGPAGLKLLPDVARAVPSPTDGGKTYTFHLKAGIHWSPPLSRVVTSGDFLYALERMADPKNGDGQAVLLEPIAGWDAYAAGKAKTISGVVIPNPSTIVFHLKKPVADFLYRIGTVIPVPREVAGCFEGKPGAYGRDLVTDGPYMIQGADKVDASSCATLKPESGFDGQTTLTLVRNPDYDPATDSKAMRQNLPDEFQFTVNDNLPDTVAQIEAGHLDDIQTITLPPQDLERYSRDPELRRFLKLVPFLATEWVMLNVTQPPLDDIHVRRALSWVLDKAAMVQLEGGTVAGSVATDIAPDALYGGQLAHYDPYRTPGSHGSLVKAKAAMKGSKYDLKGDGTCSASVCKDVVLLTETTAIAPELATVIQQDAAKIGIGITVRPVGEPYQLLETVRNQIPMAEFTGAGVSEPDPVAMFWPCFDGRAIIPVGNCDYSLLGITAAQCRTMHVTGDCNPYDPKTGLGVPSVNGMLDRCIALAGEPRRHCWEQLEEHLMTQAVPVIPYITPTLPHIIGRRVTRWVGDEASGTTGYAHVAVSSS